MKKIWDNIPKVFRISLIVSLIVVIIASGVAGYIGGIPFGLESFATGGFSVALLCVYVVCVGNIMARVRSAVEEGSGKEVATSAVSQIMIFSFVRLLILSVVLVICVAVFHFSVYAAVVGVSGVYLPLLVVPFFVTSGSDKDTASAASDADPGKV